MRKNKLSFGLIGLMLFSSGCSESHMFGKGHWFKHSESESSSSRGSRRYLKQLGIRRLPESDIPIVVNDRVMAWVDYFRGPGRERFGRYLERSGQFRTMIQSTLKQEGVPQDLLYLALIESGFSTHAYSRARASGPWQFIRSTGHHYGVKDSRWADERRDPEKSTIAAAKYLKKLYQEFGDWYLAMAAYNSGEGKIHNAIEATGSKDFWVLSAPETRYLRAETKDYVPKFLAASIIGKMPEEFGFNNVNYRDPMTYDRVAVQGPLDLKVAARLAGTSVETILQLNPELKRKITPPQKNYELRVPVGTKETFEKSYAALPKSKRLYHETTLAETEGPYHKVRRGETVAKIARRYGVSTQELLAANGLRSAKSLRVGKRLVIPEGGTVVATEKSIAKGDHVTHILQNGESLWTVAQHYNVTVSDLKHWNKISSHRSLQVGRELMIFAQNAPLVASADEKSAVAAASSVTTDAMPQSPSAGVQPPVVSVASSQQIYKVRRGDTLWTIAKKFHTSVASIKEINQLTRSSVRAGEKIKIVALATE